MWQQVQGPQTESPAGKVATDELIRAPASLQKQSGFRRSGACSFPEESSPSPDSLFRVQRTDHDLLVPAGDWVPSGGCAPPLPRDIGVADGHVEEFDFGGGLESVTEFDGQRDHSITAHCADPTSVVI